MQESLAAEHSRELITHALEEFLDRGRVTDERAGHLETARWNGADRGLNVVRDPLNEVGGILVLDVAHLIFDFFHGHFTTKDGGAGQVATVAEIGGCHHVLRVEHLLGEFGN